jgi:hypothetical protein
MEKDEDIREWRLYRRRLVVLAFALYWTALLSSQVLDALVFNMDWQGSASVIRSLALGSGIEMVPKKALILQGRQVSSRGNK